MRKKTESPPPHAPRLFGIPAAAATSLLYFLFGLLWIFFSDLIASKIAITEEQLYNFSSIKGWLFISVTALLLYALLRKVSKKGDTGRQQLHESRQRLAIATRAGGIGVWDMDLQTARLIWDDRMYEIYGIRKENFDGSYATWERYVHSDDREQIQAEIAEAKHDGKPFNTEFRIIRPDAEVRHIRAFAKTIRAADGTPLRMIGTNQDITEQKFNEEKVRVSEARFRDLLDNLPDLVWFKDPDGIYLNCNRRFEELFGTTEAEIKGKTDYDFVSKELADFFRKRDRMATENKKPTKNNEWVTFASDGHRELLETIKTPLFGSDGSLTGVLGIGRDITERVETEKRFRTMFETIHTGVAIYRPIENNRNFIFVDMNPAGLEYGKISREQVVGHKLTDVFPGVEESGLLNVFQEVADTGNPKHYPLVQYKDKRIEQWVENDVFKLPSGLVVAVFSDITEKHKAEEQIRLQATVLDQIRDFITITDLTGKITYVNQAEEKLFQCNASELIGKTVQMYGDSPNGGISQKEIIEQTIGNGHWRGEVTNTLPDGQTVLIDCRTQLIYDSRGKPTGMCGIGTDITDRKKIEIELKRHNTELEQFNKMATGRELRMIELKKEINALCRELNRKEPYA